MCDADPCSGVVLRLFLCWDCGFDSCWQYGCMSLVSVACCQVEVSVSGWSPLQRNPTECGVECRTGCYFETSPIRRPWPTGVCWALEKNVNCVACCMYISPKFLTDELPLLKNIHIYVYMGTAVAQWLSCCVTNRKVAGSILAGVIGIFHWHKILPIALRPWGRPSL